MKEIVRYIIILGLSLPLLFTSAKLRHKDQSDKNKYIGTALSLVAAFVIAFLIVGDFLIEKFSIVTFYIGIGLAFVTGIIGYIVINNHIKKHFSDEE